jgi:hypothetical protein
LIPS